MHFLQKPGIDGTETLLLTPTKEGTSVQVSSDIEHIHILLKNGFTVGEVVLSETRPKHIGGLVLPE